MAEVLKASRSGYYEFLLKEESGRKIEDKILKEKIKDIHQKSRKVYGSPRIHYELKKQGETISRKRVARLMKKKPAFLKAEQIIERLETFLGKDSKLFKNSHGDLLIESKDGLKQFRMDFNHPKPHKNPHSHLIEYEMRKKEI